VDLFKVQFRSSVFDLIIIAHAIRYVLKGNENKFINKINKWLKTDGMFIVIRYEMMQIPIILDNFKKYVMRKKEVSMINSEKGLIELMSTKFVLVDTYKSGIVFHSSVGYRPSRIKAYYFLKK